MYVVRYSVQRSTPCLQLESLQKAETTSEGKVDQEVREKTGERIEGEEWNMLVAAATPFAGCLPLTGEKEGSGVDESSRSSMMA